MITCKACGREGKDSRGFTKIVTTEGIWWYCSSTTACRKRKAARSKWEIEEGSPIQQTFAP